MSAQSVAGLLHILIDNCPKPDGSVHPGGEYEEILLDMELEGARYLLVRLPRPDHRVQLSPREQEIVRMVADGHPNKTIAGVLNISPWTVCTYLRRIFAKLGVSSRAAMVARMLEIGWAWEPSPKLQTRGGSCFEQGVRHGLVQDRKPNETSRLRQDAVVEARPP